MTNKHQTENTETFEATLTLRQEGRDGEVLAFLSFAPLDVEAGPDGQPEAFNRMAVLMQTYLYMTGMTDERGNLLEQTVDDSIDVEITEYNRSIN